MNSSPYRTSTKMKFAMAGMVIEGLLSGSLFLILLEILKLVFGNGVTMKKIISLTAIVICIFLLRILVYSVSYITCQTEGSCVSRNMRIAMGDKLKKIPLSLFTKNRTGFYINAATSEVSDYEMVLTHKISLIIQLGCVLLACKIYTCTLNLLCGIILLITTLLLIPCTASCIGIVNKYGTHKNLAREKNVSSITEYLSGSQTLRSYGLVGTKNKDLTEAMRDYSDVSYHYEKATLPPGFIFNFFSFLGMGLIIIFAVKSYLCGNISSSDLLMLIMLPTFTATINMTEAINLIALRNLLLSKRKLDTIYNEREDYKEDDSFCPKSYDIQFKDVSFSYVKGEQVLDKVNLKIPQNKFTAIVGDSGSGKSTILNLICKYYEQDSGEITIGGCSTRNVPAQQVLSYISLVDQDVFLFNDTIKNNIRYAKPDATDEDIINACKLANCDSFIRSMEHGYDTLTGENGNKLSGGERQRISIARAILKDSPIILLDEATASLDIENELLVKKAIVNLLKGNKTVVMIAHTLPIIQNADNIIVINNHEVEESGNHNKLLENKGKYSAMWNASLCLK